LERNELITAVILVLVSLLLGFGLYAIFFYPLSGELRPRYKGGRQRAARWFKAKGKWILIALLLLAAALGLLYAGLRFGGEILERVRDLVGPSQTEGESMLVPEPVGEPEGEPWGAQASDWQAESRTGLAADPAPDLEPPEAVPAAEEMLSEPAFGAAGDTRLESAAGEESWNAFDSVVDSAVEQSPGSLPPPDSSPAADQGGGITDFGNLGAWE